MKAALTGITGAKMDRMPDGEDEDGAEGERKAGTAGGERKKK